jgi:PAS domain S-box-containing protein
MSLSERFLEQYFIWQSQGYVTVMVVFLGSLILASFLWSWSLKRLVRKRIAELTEILDLIPEQIFIKDLKGRYVLANKAVAEAYGTTVDKLIGSKDSYFHESPAEVEMFLRDDAKVIKTGNPKFISELHFRDSKRHNRVLQVIKIPYRLPGMNEVAALGVALDITARKRAEEALRESRRELRAVIDAVPAMISAKNWESRYIFMNRYQADLYGITPDDAVDRTATEILGADYGARTASLDRKVFATGEAIPRYDEDWVDAGGRKHNLLKTKVPLYDQNHAIVNLVTVALDITERKQAEEALQLAKDESERANLTKSRFLAAASHDLRQPLQTLRLLLTALRQTRKESERRETVEEMAHALVVMDSVLNALLDNSMLDAGTIVPQIADFTLDALMNRIVGVYGPLSREKGLELRVVPCSAVVRSDAALVERVVENFVSNAVRYTDEGKVLIGCRRRGDQLCIEIRDSGRGIPSDQRDAIFDEFYQVGNPGRDHSQGLGLGLSISKRVADILGHRIEVQSTPGKGSVFSVDLPLSAAQEQPREALAPVLVGGNGRMIGLVLLIEDNPSVLNAMVRLLALWGVRVVTAKTRQEALAHLETATVSPDLAIADYRLPDGQGAEVLKTAQRVLQRPLPGVIISGDTTPTMIREAEAAGFRVLQKPVDPDELHSIMSEILAVPAMTVERDLAAASPRNTIAHKARGLLKVGAGRR